MDPKVDSIEKTIFVGNRMKIIYRRFGWECDIRRYLQFICDFRYFKLHILGIIRSIEMPADHISGNI
jgi:hypothetical protein